MPVLEMLLLIGALVVSAVFLHYEGLHRLDRWAERNARLGASRLYFIVLAILAVHVGEVLVYAGGFALGARAGLGHLEGVAAPELPRLSVYAFVSAEIFTSLGFGDLYPTGWLRLVAGVECLNGLILIGWSSSFTYLAMRRFWQTVTARPEPARPASLGRGLSGWAFGPATSTECPRFRRRCRQPRAKQQRPERVGSGGCWRRRDDGRW